MCSIVCIIVCNIVYDLTVGLERTDRATGWLTSQHQLSDGQIGIGMLMICFMQ